MFRDQFIRWGTWPARITSAVIVLYGAFALIRAQMLLSSQQPNLDLPEMIPQLIGQMFDGILLIVAGLLIAGLTWLSRRRDRRAALAGLILSFFLAGLIMTYGLSANLSGIPLFAAAAGGVCLLISAASTLLNHNLFSTEASPDG